METTSTAPATPAAEGGAASATTATPAATPSAEPAEVRLTSAQLKERLDEARKSGESGLVKALGFASKADADAAVKAAKAASDAQLTEQQRLTNSIAELTPKAQRADALAAQLKVYADREFAALPEGVQRAVDSVAGGDPDKRLAQIEVFRQSGLLASAPSAPLAPAPANAAPSAATPKPTSPMTPWEQYQSKIASGNRVGADIFYQTNRAAIASSAPKGA